jgi:hypothetical protein
MVKEGILATMTVMEEDIQQEGEYMYCCTAGLLQQKAMTAAPSCDSTR